MINWRASLCAMVSCALFLLFPGAVTLYALLFCIPAAISFTFSPKTEPKGSASYTTRRSSSFLSIRSSSFLGATTTNKPTSFDCDVPLIFVHGMKGAHLAFNDPERRRAWLCPRALLNLPPRPDGHPFRDLSLPLTYKGTVQDRGALSVDGMVDHIFELYGSIGFLPFYGHVSQYLAQLQDQGVRPTRSFVYDWRRSLPEISQEFHQFCEREFPGTPVQLLAHSMGGLVAFEPMRNHPEKYAPGATLVGVPFGTGIQYFQDLHRGYYTELDRNRQFTPPSQFCMSSHWSFFPMSQEDVGDTFVDVTNQKDTGAFVPDQSAIGNPGNVYQPSVAGDNIQFDFYNVEEWEKNEVGIFDPKYKSTMDEKTLHLYKEHMKIQLKLGKEWRQRALRPSAEEDDTMPDLVVCQTDTVPTLNQIQRRKRVETEPEWTGEQRSQWEYDYISGRSVPGDGRIDFDKSFPPTGFEYKTVKLDSMHAKQMCWEDSGGSFGTVLDEVSGQLERYRVMTDMSSESSQTSLVPAMEPDSSMESSDASLGSAMELEASLEPNSTPIKA